MYKISVVLATLVAIIYCEPSFNFNIYTRNSHRSSYAYPESSRSRSFPLSVIEAVPSVIRTVVERVSTPLRRSNNNRRIDSRPVYYSNYPEYYKSVTSKPKSTTLKSYGFKLFELPKLTPKTVPVSEPSNVIETITTPAPTPPQDFTNFELRNNGFDPFRSGVDLSGVDLSTLDLESYDDVDLESFDYG